jgi:hypothetical protein
LNSSVGISRSLDGDDAYVMFRIAIFLPFFCQRQIAIERG